MGLLYILRRFAQDTGINCFASGGQEVNVDDRQYALDIINESTKQLWQDKDLTGSLQECVVQCLDCQQITTPSFVGIVRAIRQHNNMLQWSLSDIRPLYHKDSWADEYYKNFRSKGTIVVARDIVNSAPPVAYITKVENPPIQLSITGSTEDAQSITETISLTTVGANPFTISFNTYTSIKKDRINTVNILIKDADELDLALLYNNELQTQYQLYDVGSLFRQYNLSAIPVNLEVLYKIVLYPFVNDTDEFPIQGYDDVILNKSLALYYGKKDNGSKAVALNTIADDDAGKISGDNLKGKDLRMEFQEVGHTKLFSNLRRGLASRWRRY